MKIAIFSDVHGNLTAFEAVLADIKHQEPDLTFFAGDLCVAGVRPKECLEMLRDEDIPAVQGNTEDWLNDRPHYPEGKTAEEKKQRQNFYDVLDWTVNQLPAADLAYLAAIPFQRRVSPTSNPNDDLLIVHANPRDVNQPIFPNETVQQSIYNEVKQPDNDPKLGQLLSDLNCRVMAYGHVHIPNIRQWNGRSGPITLANISSVSLPLDGDSRAKYGMLTWNGSAAWEISHRYVEYDIKHERQFLSQKKPPNWESLSERLG